MAYAYTGRVLRVDLSRETISVEEPGDAVYRSYLGGNALAAYYLLRELKPGVDPLGPDNLLVFATSLLNGTPGPGLSRFTVAAKSPLTGGFGKAEAGGWWGPEMKLAGYDAVIFSGRAARPVYLYVRDGEASLRSAEGLWGRETAEVAEAIRAELGDPKIRIAQIGPGGEKLVRYACVLNELKHSNGRTGMGSVMGSKNLRAIAVRGTTRPAFADPEGVEATHKRILANYKRTPGDFHDTGTSGGVGWFSSRGILPTRNFRQGSFEGASAITGAALRDTIMIGRGTCYGCPVSCKREVEVDNGTITVSPTYGGPEYETIGAFGSLCGIDDLSAISKGNELCNRFGVDTISCGTTIAWAMEAFEAGYLTKADTDGIELRFGNVAAMLAMVEKICRREGFGDLLAEGALRAARKIGKGEELVMHAKGQEFPMHEGRGKQGVGLGFALSPTGAEHMEGPHDTDYEEAGGPALQALDPLGVHDPVPATDMGPNKVSTFHVGRQAWNLYDCVGLCYFFGAPFGPFTLPMLADYVSAATGWKTSLYELAKVAERYQNMARLFNLREGLTADDDALPPRMFQPFEDGVLKGVAINEAEFKAAKRLYYEMAGWDPATAMPTRGKLAELGLLWAAQ